MSKKVCAVGCPPSKYLFMFPCKDEDKTRLFILILFSKTTCTNHCLVVIFVYRRKLWMDFFDLEEPHTKYVYACERHFSQYQYYPTSKGIKRDAVPDVP